MTLSFGALDISNMPGAMTTGRFTETCIQGLQTSYVGVCARFGRGGSGDEFNRTMRDGAGNAIAYGLYHDPQMTIPWLGNSETVFLAAPYDKGSGATLQGTLYAKILSGTANLPAGEYRDDIVGSAVVAGETGYDGFSNVCLSGAPGDAPALSVVATLQASCSISASNMVFPESVSPSSSATATATLSVACTKGTSYEVSLSVAAGATARKMNSEKGETILYGLYKDAAHSQPWGDSAGSKLSNRGDGAPQNLTVYGFAPPQPAPPGAYRDMVIVTLAY